MNTWKQGGETWEGEGAAQTIRLLTFWFMSYEERTSSFGIFVDYNTYVQIKISSG